MRKLGVATHLPVLEAGVRGHPLPRPIPRLLHLLLPLHALKLLNELVAHVTVAQAAEVNSVEGSSFGVQGC